MLCTFENASYDTRDTLKRRVVCFEELAHAAKRPKPCLGADEPSCAKLASPSAPLVANAVGSIRMTQRNSSTSSTCSSSSSPYVEIEDYILEGYGSALINDNYNSRLSLDNIAPVNYCLYDLDAEEFDDSDNCASDGKTLLESPDAMDVEDIEMQD
ncbi:LAFE_0C11584g1_1 [Lachancea fermentati]|uniref:LAFE_0C11584g1_1 n=1 Tax=Lachancea fermentati TaxID=4955 RepID=A0A1G4MA59_LACFM|nr:LAFE_0C11584g1_1 [Lachancea fermentati]